MKKSNKNLIPRDRGRPRFTKSPGMTRVKVAGIKRGGLVKNIFASLKRSRKGL